ncbi:MAG: hypothetical protein QNK37_34740 [Acidobacteriota bacterium]|nr:hypothetical protein [Acidobacteriota bacterium]
MVKPLDEAALSALPMTGGRMDVRFEDNADVKTQLEQFIGNQGLFVSTGAAARPFSEFELVMHLPDGKTCDPARARLVQVVPYGDQPGLMLQFLDLPPTVEPQLKTFLAKKEAPPIPTRNQPPAQKEMKNGEAGPGDRQTIFDRIRKLRPDERSRLAGRANKMERSVLIRDTEAVVIMFLLKNPNLTRGEAMEISRLKTINHQVVTQLLSNKQWAQIEELRYNLSVNPKTPTSIVLKLLPGLSMKHLREMAKNHGLKNQVKQAALRIVLKNAGT